MSIDGLPTIKLFQKLLNIILLHWRNAATTRDALLAGQITHAKYSSWFIRSTELRSMLSSESLSVQCDTAHVESRREALRKPKAYLQVWALLVGPRPDCGRL